MAISDAPNPASRTLRVLSRLLGYPGPELRAHLSELRTALHAEAALPERRLAELDDFIGALARQDPLDAQADYVQLFDSGRRTALHLFEHVHGDSRERGPAMIDLARTYEQAGLYLAAGEMPDHLPVVLEFASTQPAAEAIGLLGEIAHLVNAVFAALRSRHSGYASAMGALLDLAGVSASAVQISDEDPPDLSWDEPAAFSGCGTGRPARPGTPQPLHFSREVRPDRSTAARGDLP
ncbi:MAG: nitrate reductase molybdenum cofactor assembly chaperone [Proteobacteria bacterium]|nr:nitrate reductase molybdenum cofactor assembly chaperone [Pseudomonadota bacterium]